jgi:hypothetical protein
VQASLALARARRGGGGGSARQSWGGWCTGAKLSAPLQGRILRRRRGGGQAVLCCAVLRCAMLARAHPVAGRGGGWLGREGGGGGVLPCDVAQGWGLCASGKRSGGRWAVRMLAFARRGNPSHAGLRCLRMRTAGAGCCSPQAF